MTVLLTTQVLECILKREAVYVLSRYNRYRWSTSAINNRKQGAESDVRNLYYLNVFFSHLFHACIIFMSYANIRLAFVIYNYPQVPRFTFLLAPNASERKFAGNPWKR